MPITTGTVLDEVARSPVLVRNNVRVTGRPDRPAVVFAHGFACDQTMWHRVAPAFEDTHQVVLFDHVGSGASDATAYDRERYGSLRGYADDLGEILDALDLHDVAFVGHSVSAMIGVLASNADPDRISRLALLGASPRYVDDEDHGYRGGFTREDIDDLLESIDRNFAEWSRAMAPVVMNTPERPELTSELEDAFLHADARIAQHFAHVTFLSDHRADVERVHVPTLILQSTADPIVPPHVAEHLHARIPGSRLVLLDATGHYPQLSGPEETIRALRDFL